MIIIIDRGFVGYLNSGANEFIKNSFKAARNIKTFPTTTLPYFSSLAFAQYRENYKHIKIYCYCIELTQICKDSK